MRTALLVIIAGIVASCNNSTEEEKPAIVKSQMLTTLPIAPDSVKGTYIGDFKGSPIAITLNYVSDNHASGYNVHKGLTRNISGIIEADGKGLHLQLSEPGNNQYDGEFDFVIDTTKWTAKGTWKPFKKGDEASFTLKKQLILPDELQFSTTYTDTLGNYLTLKTDGSCTYSYLTDSTNTGQQITVHGNYTKETGKMNFYWEKNNVFPSQKSVFKLIETKPDKESDYVERSLKGEGKVFTEIFN